MNTYMQRLQDSIDSATRGMSALQLSRRPAEGKWSPAEVLEHLALTYKGTSKNLERSLNSTQPPVGIPTFKQRAINILVLDIGYLPKGRTSPETAKPRGMATDGIVDEIKTRIAAMDAVIDKCESKYGKHAIVGDHPILGPFTAKQWRQFHWVHGQHHVKQIERMRANQ
jgi:hypothetical protein